MVDRICLYCETPFKTWEAWIRKNNNTGGRFCSKSCNLKYNKPIIEEFRNKKAEELREIGISIGGRPKTSIKKICFTCKGEFEVPFSQSETLCCSRKCFFERVKTLPKHPYKPKLSIRGENHYNWKGGISDENIRIRQSPEYAQWRKSVFQRDLYTCQICGIKNKKGVKVKFHADHIKSFSQYPELRLELSNGRTLCLDCHKNTPSFGSNRRNKKLPNEQSEINY